MEVRDLMTGRIVQPGDYEPDEIALMTTEAPMTRQEAIDLISVECAKIQAAQVEAIRQIGVQLEALIKAVLPIFTQAFLAGSGIIKKALDDMEKANEQL